MAKLYSPAIAKPETLPSVRPSRALNFAKAGHIGTPMYVSLKKLQTHKGSVICILHSQWHKTIPCG
jgi:hypothetical protein